VTTSLRGKGESVLGEMPRGTHVCVYYESLDDLIDTVVPFFKIGLEKNEFCMWVPSKLAGIGRHDPGHFYSGPDGFFLVFNDDCFGSQADITPNSISNWQPVATVGPE
jgi:hypothetical protein